MRSIARLVPSAALAATMALAFSALAVGVSSRSASSQRPTACVETCRAAERAAVAACRDARCRRQAGFESRRCALRCDTGLSPVARCRAECGIASDECDAGCQDLPDGERRGCLRRCGSRHHVSCPRSCEGMEEP